MQIIFNESAVRNVRLSRFATSYKAEVHKLLKKITYFSTVFLKKIMIYMHFYLLDIYDLLLYRSYSNHFLFLSTSVCAL